MSSAQWSADIPLNVGTDPKQEWTDCTITSIPTRSPANFWSIIQINDSGSGEDYGSCYPPDVWNTVDCSHWVPVGTKAICIEGILILTHSGVSDVSDVTVAYRKNGETYDFGYVMQTLSYFQQDGSRSNAGTKVCLDSNYLFQFKWHAQSPDAFHGMGLRITEAYR